MDLLHSFRRCFESKSKNGKSDFAVYEETRPRRPTMRPYSVLRMIEFLVVAVIEEIVGDSFNFSACFQWEMTLRSYSQ